MMDSYDQTQFVIEEPLYEKTQKTVVKPAVESELPAKKSRSRFIIAAGVGLFILIFILVIYVALSRQSQPASEELVEEEQTTTEMGPYRQQLDDLRDQLQAADPAKDELPFPPINMSIQLEEDS